MLRARLRCSQTICARVASKAEVLPTIYARACTRPLTRRELLLVWHLGNAYLKYVDPPCCSRRQNGGRSPACIFNKKKTPLHRPPWPFLLKLILKSCYCRVAFQAKTVRAAEDSLEMTNEEDRLRELRNSREKSSPHNKLRPDHPCVHRAETTGNLERSGEKKTTWNLGSKFGSSV